MNWFYLNFILTYYLCSTLGLIVDIFMNENRINSITIFSIKQHYLEVSNNVNTNVLLRSFPFIMLAEIMYINYDTNLSIGSYIAQYIITIILGINLEYLLHRFKHSKYFYKYHKKHHECNKLFGYMAFYEHPYDFCLSMILVIFPIFLRFDPIIFKLWISLLIFKKCIMDYSNLYIIGSHYNLHHTLKQFNFGFYYWDKFFDTINTDYNILKKKSDDIKTLPPSDHYKCYSYLCKANNKSNDSRFKNKHGKLHYSNFF